MATKELVSNLKLITSGNVPTTSKLKNGELAFGLVDGVAKLYGNVNGTIVDFSNFADANKSVAQAAAWKKIATQDEIEAGGGTPYVTTISSWSGSNGNYYSIISASTHGKGTYPSVHTYVQNGNLWKETYDSPAIDSSGNVTVYTNSAISIKVVIK